MMCWDSGGAIHLFNLFRALMSWFVAPAETKRDWLG